MNTNMLKSKMVLYGDTSQSLAEYLGISKASLLNKINENGTEFRQGEISKIRERYKLTPQEVMEIFFN